MAFNKALNRSSSLSLALGAFAFSCATNLIFLNNNALAEIPDTEVNVATDTISTKFMDSKVQQKARCQVSHFYSSDDFSVPISEATKSFQTPITNLSSLSQTQLNSPISKDLLAQVNPVNSQQGFEASTKTDGINPLQTITQYCRWGCWTCSAPNPADPCYPWYRCWDCR